MHGASVRPGAGRARPSPRRASRRPPAPRPPAPSSAEATSASVSASGSDSAASPISARPGGGPRRAPPPRPHPDDLATGRSAGPLVGQIFDRRSTSCSSDSAPLTPGPDRRSRSERRMPARPWTIRRSSERYSRSARHSSRAGPEPRPVAGLPDLAVARGQDAVDASLAVRVGGRFHVAVHRVRPDLPWGGQQTSNRYGYGLVGTPPGRYEK